MTLINLILLILAGASVLAAIISAVAGLSLRSRVASSAYGVGRQEMRRTMQVSFIRALVFGVLALIFLGVYGLSARPDELLSTDPGAENTPPAVGSPTPDLRPTNTLSPPTATTTRPAAASPSATTPAAETVTPTDTPTPTITPTPEPSAIVTAPAGLYLRDVPGGTAELELVAAGTSLVLLPGRETVDDLDWQQVRTPSGLEGWVAADFLDYQQ